MNSRKRVFKDELLGYGFVAITEKGVIKPHFTICYAELCLESLKPSQLQKHLCNKHPELTDKSREFSPIGKPSEKTETGSHAKSDI